MSVTATITPEKIRDGDPEALAALCEVGGAAMFAYCEHVVAPGHAINAVADAFARFRAAIVAAEELTPQDADALLRGMTRRAAASCSVNTVAARTGAPFSGTCDGQETGLVDYVEGDLSLPERDVVAAHVATCSLCDGALRRLQAGERALARPPSAPLPPAFAQLLLEALVVAAPVQARDGDVAAVRAAALLLLANGASPHAAIPSAPIAAQPSLGAASTPAIPTPLPKTPVPPPAAIPDPQPETPSQPSAALPEPWPESIAPLPAVALPATRGAARSRRLRRPRRPAVAASVLPHRSRVLIRGAARLLGVVILAAAGGVMLGIVITQLTG